MTPDEIEKAAIEAAAIEIYMSWMDQPGWVLWVVGGTSRLQQAARQVARDARNAFEREMWRPVAEAPHGEPVILFSPGRPLELRPYSTGRSSPSGSSMSHHAFATHFRPLPKPEGV